MSWQVIGGYFRNYGTFDTNYAWSSGLYVISALPTFSAGIFLYYNFDKKSLRIFYIISVLAIIHIFISIFQLFEIGLIPPIKYFNQATYGTFGFLIYGSLGLVILKNILENKKIFTNNFELYLSELGVVSYSVYLWNLPVLVYTKRLDLNLIASISLSSLLIGASSSISYLFIEKLFMNWSKKRFN
jgi:peptidoglycan/LPS O-acetylase OafA/YrhL